MKWKIYSVPETIKIITCKKIMGTGKYQSKWSDIIVFTDFVQRQLNKIKKFEVDKEYTLQISEKENYKTIIDFARFCMNLHKNPFGKCEYMEIFNNTMADGQPISKIFDIKQGIANEVFLFSNYEEGMSVDDLKIITFVISGVRYTNEKSIRIKCISN